VIFEISIGCQCHNDTIWFYRFTQVGRFRAFTLPCFFLSTFLPSDFKQPAIGELNKGEIIPLRSTFLYTLSAPVLS
jgi:hypothetical protein